MTINNERCLTGFSESEIPPSPLKKFKNLSNQSDVLRTRNLQMNGNSNCMKSAQEKNTLEELSLHLKTSIGPQVSRNYLNPSDSAA